MKKILLILFAALLLTGSGLLSGCSSSVTINEVVKNISYEKSDSTYSKQLDVWFKYKLKIEHGIITLTIAGFDFEISPLFDRTTSSEGTIDMSVNWRKDERLLINHSIDIESNELRISVFENKYNIPLEQ